MPWVPLKKYISWGCFFNHYFSLFCLNIVIEDEVVAESDFPAKKN